MSEFKYLDEKGNEISVDIKNEDFNFLQDHQRIYDEKFQTKTTTFLKDAFKRFCRNKSSVVAAFIIGILVLCSIFVPLFSPYDVSKTTYPYQALLQPKLFKAGTGFWDGTDHYSNQVYDVVEDEVVGGSFVKDYMYNVKYSENLYTDKAIVGAHGGTLVIAQNRAAAYAGETASYYNYYFFDITSNVPVVFTVDFNDKKLYEELSFAKYKLYVEAYTESNPSANSESTRYYIDTEWSENYGVRSVNLATEVLAKIGKTELKNVRVGIEYQLSQDTKKYSYLGFDSIKLTTDSQNATPEYKEQLATLSITDANVQVLQTRNDQGFYPNSFWYITSGERRVNQAIYKLVEFDYDKYAQQFGSRSVELTSTNIQTYIDNGWMTFESIDANNSALFDENGRYIGEINYKILDDRCPIYDEVDDNGNVVPGIKSITRIRINDSYILAYNAQVQYYKYVGYSSMPIFILGTTEAGYDLFTLAFFALRTSLSLAILVSAVNFMIGLVWGSICGYFGGNIDLVMERIKDILSGMPFIVVVTLCILHLGNNVLTFGIALCLTGWIGTASRTRTQFYRFRGREYVLASRTLGASNTRLIFRHILPNALGTIVTGAVLMIPSVIFSEATLAYLNLGLQGSASFGVLLSDNQKYLSTLPVLIIFPAVIISLLMISFNLFGNGLRDALNPSLKGSD